MLIQKCPAKVLSKTTVTNGSNHTVLPASPTKEKEAHWSPLRSTDDREEGSQLQGPGDPRWVNLGPHCIHLPGAGRGDAQR